MSGTDREEARRAGIRLRAELGAAIRSLRLPSGASALARALELDRVLCQRIVRGLEADDGIEVLRRVPGWGGLSLALDALGRAGLDAGALASLEEAIRTTRELTERLGPSRTRLLERLNAAPGLTEESRNGGEEVRARLMLAAAELVGRRASSVVFLNMYRPSPANPDLIERTSVSGLIGLVTRAQGMPMIMGSGRLATDDPSAGRSMNLDETPAAGVTPSALLEEFCSRPLARVISRTPTTGLQQIVECEPGVASDVVTARWMASGVPHPAHDQPPEHCVWMLPGTPASALLGDVYLHRSLAQRSIASVSAHLMDVHRPDATDWATRLRDQPALELLGPGLGRSDHDAYGRQGELTRRVFERLGWDPEQFVGYRVFERFPVWRAAYCVRFDFAETGAG